MPIEVTMPRLSDTMEQGTVVKWHVKEGDDVASGDVIADIETDKATMELQSFDEGKVARLVVPEGQSVGIGSVIAVLAGEGESADEAGAARDGDPVDFVERQPRPLERVADRRQDELEVPPRCDLGHDAAVARMELRLRRDDIGEDLAAGRDDGRRGLVAARLDAEHGQGSAVGGLNHGAIYSV